MIDTHCHLTCKGLSERVGDVLAAAHDAGVDRMITVGTTPDDAASAAALASQHEGVYSTVGLHPHHVDDSAAQDTLRSAMHRLSSQSHVVALGEMGLDYHYPDPPREQQQRAFEWQLEACTELPGLPCIIHNRKATDDVLAMIRAAGISGERFVFHCFAGASDDARKILDLGAMISFTGIVTFPNAQEVAEASDLAPMDRLMVETDSPYLTPAPHRKVRPNEPRYVVDVARFLAKRRGMAFEEFAAQADRNAERFFALDERVS